MSDEQRVLDAVRRVRDRVDAAAERVGRAPSDVELLVASKTQPAERILPLLHAGWTLLGENRVQEIVDKAPDLAAVPHRTHLIGHLQRNKVNAVLPHLDCLQTVDSADLVERLQRRLDADGRELDVMVQVNVSGEESKSGVAPDRTAELVAVVRGAASLRLVGLMTIGLHSDDEAAVRAGYARLRELRDELVPGGALSMGMSGDLEAAIAEGATLVRVGSGVFGPRG